MPQTAKKIGSLLICLSLVAIPAGILFPWEAFGGCSEKKPSVSFCPGTYVVCETQSNGSCLGLPFSAHLVQIGPFSCQDTNAETQCVDSIVLANCTKLGSCKVVNAVCKFNTDTLWRWTARVKKVVAECPAGT